MFDYLLAPMGVAAVPRTIEEAVESYVAARDAFERRSGARVDRAGFDVPG